MRRWIQRPPSARPRIERAQHQLEGVRRGPEDERQHPDPGHFVDERGRAGDQCGAKEREQDRVAPPLGLLGLRGGRRMAAGERQHRCGDGEVDEASDADRPRQADRADEHEPADQDPGRGAQAVREVEHGQRAARPVGEGAQHAGRHQREGHSEQDGLRQDERGGEAPLERGDGPRRSGQTREHRVEGEPGRRREHLVEQEGEDADGSLGDGISREQVAPPARPPAGQPRPQGEPAHEDGEHQRLRVRGVPEEQLQIVRPDGLVDQTGETRRGEQGEQQSSRPRPRGPVLG